jgi:hypothetical protein
MTSEGPGCRITVLNILFLTLYLLSYLASSFFKVAILFLSKFFADIFELPFFELSSVALSRKYLYISSILDNSESVILQSLK